MKTSNTKRKLLGFFLIYMLVTWSLVIAYISFNHDNFSRRVKIYDSTEDFYKPYKSLKNSSEIALNKMLAWLKSSNYSEEFRLFDKPKMVQMSFNRNIQTLCVGIMTKERYGNWNTAAETVASLLSRIKRKYEDRVLLYLFDFSVNNRDDLVAIKKLIREIKLNISNHAFNSANEGAKVKEAFHYSKVLSYFSSEHGDKCKYLAVIEDDAIAAPDWFSKIISSINELEAKYENRWLLLKLFTSLRPFDWLIYTPLILYSIIFVTALTLIQLFIIQKTINFLQMVSLLRNKQVILSVIILNTILIKGLLNTYNIFPLGFGVFKYSQGFNTVANVYPIDKAEMIGNYLTDMLNDYKFGTSDFYPKDIAIRKLSSKTKLSEFIVEPSVVQHIGFYSSLGTTREMSLNEINKLYKRPFKSHSFDRLFSFPIQFDYHYWLS